jgi:hypothetical protein
MPHLLLSGGDRLILSGTDLLDLYVETTITPGEVVFSGPSVGPVPGLVTTTIIPGAIAFDGPAVSAVAGGFVDLTAGEVVFDGPAVFPFPPGGAATVDLEAGEIEFDGGLLRVGRPIFAAEGRATVSVASGDAEVVE